MIATTQMFRDFVWHDIEALSGYMQVYEASDGTTLFRKGEKGTYMCLIIKGKVDVHKEDHNDRKKIVAEPTILTILTETNFLRIVSEKPALATKILLKMARLLSQRLRRTSGQLVDYLES